LFCLLQLSNSEQQKKKPKQKMLLRLRQLNKIAGGISRSFCQSAVRLNDKQPTEDISGSVATRFQVFRNETGIIFDIEEERRRREQNEIDEGPINDYSPFEGLNMERKWNLISFG
jgi:hypothetical protein